MNNIFEIHRWDWWEHMDRMMQNVNLDKISFEQNNHMTFTFLNSYNGAYYKTLRCGQILKCCIENEALEDEPFAYFVLDIFKRELSLEELESSFAYYKYGYPVDISLLGRQYLVMIIGSEICIEMICGEVRVTEDER